MRLTALLFVTSALAAQDRVSPVFLEDYDGNGSANMPFGPQTMRYQQVHGDVTAPLVVTALSWRRDSSDYYSMGKARTTSLELVLCAADASQVRSTFDANYSGTPVLAIAKKSISYPDWMPAPSVGPAPFTLKLLFDTAFSYTGQKGLLWEIRTHGNSLGLDEAMSVDTVSRTNTTSLNAPFRWLGQGCHTSNGTMTLSAIAFASRNAAPFDCWSVSWTMLGGPPYATSALLLGLRNPGLPVPGLCGGTLYTDGAITLSGSTWSDGAFRPGGFTLPYDPPLVGLKLYAQAASVDASGPAPQVLASQGLQTMLPPLPAVTAIPITRVFATNVAALGGTVDFTGIGAVTGFHF